MTQYSFDNLPDIPAITELKQRPHWVAWKCATRMGADGKPYQTKVPGQSADQSKRQDQQAIELGQL